MWCPRKDCWSKSCWLHPLESGPEVDQGRGETRGQGGQIFPGAKPWGSESLRGQPKSINKVTSTFFNTVHLLPKDLRLEHGGQIGTWGRQSSVFPRRHLTSLRPWTKDQVVWLHLQPGLVPFCCGASRAVRELKTMRSFETCLGQLSPRPFAEEHPVWKWMKKNWNIYKNILHVKSWCTLDYYNCLVVHCSSFVVMSDL